jgi:hypothetical protein
MSTASLHRSDGHTLTRPSAATLAKLITYATSLAGIYLSVGFLFYYAAKEKLIDNSGTMPTGLRKEFAGSLFASIPGDNTSWILLGLVEAAVVILLAASLAHGEFLTNHRKPFLLAGLGTAMFALGLMGLANNMVGDNATALELFTYFGLIPILIILIRQMPPYRSLDWLAGGKDKS